jgi:hypothetical protein
MTLISPVQALPSISLYPILILLSSPLLGLQMATLRFNTTAYIYISSSRCVPHARPSRPSWFDSRHSIWWGVHTIKLHIAQFAPVSCYFLPLSLKCLPESPVFRTPSACVLLLMLEAKNKEENYSLYILIFIFLDNRGEDKRFWTKW